MRDLSITGLGSDRGSEGELSWNWRRDTPLSRELILHAQALGHQTWISILGKSMRCNYMQSICFKKGNKRIIASTACNDWGCDTGIGIFIGHKADDISVRCWS